MSTFLKASIISNVYSIRVSGMFGGQFRQELRSNGRSVLNRSKRFGIFISVGSLTVYLLRCAFVCHERLKRILVFQCGDYAFQLLLCIIWSDTYPDKPSLIKQS